MKFNNRLREVRRLHGKTQQDMCNDLEVSHNCYASWEQGRTEPGLDKLASLCGLLKVSADYLLGISETTEITDEATEKDDENKR